MNMRCAPLLHYKIFNDISESRRVPDIEKRRNYLWANENTRY
jgi:hypothetical protein